MQPFFAVALSEINLGFRSKSISIFFVVLSVFHFMKIPPVLKKKSSCPKKPVNIRTSLKTRLCRFFRGSHSRLLHIGQPIVHGSLKIEIFRGFRYFRNPALSFQCPCPCPFPLFRHGGFFQKWFLEVPLQIQKSSDTCTWLCFPLQR